MEKTYRYLGYFMLVLIPLTFAGFYKSYFEKFPNFEPEIDFYIHIHAFIAAVWIVLLIVQPILILNKRYSAHRSLGKLSYFIFPLLILSFIPQVIKTIYYGNIINLFFTIADGSLLIVFYSLAIYNRKVSSKHMRYMIASALVFLGPTVGRIGPYLLGLSEVVTQNVQYAIIYGILVGLIFYDKSHAKNYYPYGLAIGGFIVHQVVFHIIFL